MEKQLEFLFTTKNNSVFVGASHLINSSHWNGELWYFPQEEDIKYDGIISNNSGGLKYPVTMSVSDGVLLPSTETKVLVAADSGWLSIYSLGTRDDYGSETSSDDASSSFVLNNDISRVEHDHSILSVSATGGNSVGLKAVTGGMDCRIVFWDIETFTPQKIYDFAHIHHVTCVRFIGCDDLGDAEDTSRTLFVSTSLDGDCLLWDQRQDFPAKVLCKYKSCGLTSIEWLNNSLNELIVGCEDGNLMSIDIRNAKEPIYSFHSFQNSVNRMNSYSYQSENYIAVSADCRTMKVLRCDDKSFTEVYCSNDHTDFVKGLAWIKKKNELLACSWDSKITKHYPFKR